MYVVYYQRKGVSGYVYKHNGMIDYVANPSDASRYYTKEDAETSGKIGHHRDMGGDGFFGRVISLESAMRDYKYRNNQSC